VLIGDFAQKIIHDEILCICARRVRPIGQTAPAEACGWDPTRWKSLTSR
jgi:hypothetical protein